MSCFSIWANTACRSILWFAFSAPIPCIKARKTQFPLGEMASTVNGDRNGTANSTAGTPLYFSLNLLHSERPTTSGTGLNFFMLTTNHTVPAVVSWQIRQRDWHNPCKILRSPTQSKLSLILFYSRRIPHLCSTPNTPCHFWISSTRSASRNTIFSSLYNLPESNLYRRHSFLKLAF